MAFTVPVTDSTLPTNAPSTTQANGFNPLNVLQSGRSYLDQVANKFVVKPKNAKGIGGFVFDCKRDDRVRLHSNISKHFAEDNSAINDHIALEPVKITLSGYSGELRFTPNDGLVGALNLIQNRLGSVRAYLGNYTPTLLGKVQSVVSKAQVVQQQIDQTLARVKNIVGMFPGMAPATSRQANAYLWLEALQVTRQIFLVETPWKVFDNMVIEDVEFVQPSDSSSVTDITVTLVQMRFVKVPKSKALRKSGRNALHSADPVDNGHATGTTATKTQLPGFLGLGPQGTQ